MAICVLLDLIFLEKRHFLSQRQLTNSRILFIFFLFIGCIFFCDSHLCGHKIPTAEEVLHNVHIEPGHVVRRRSVDQSLRIHLVYDESVDALPEDKQNLVKNKLIPAAVAFWESTLKVRETHSPIKLLRQCKTPDVLYQETSEGEKPMPYCQNACHKKTFCGEVEVPPEHLQACRYAVMYGESVKSFNVSTDEGKGVTEADFILYVSAHSQERCSIGTTVAYAAYCQLEAALDRPIAGYVNLCPDGISTHSHDMHQMHSTIKHEILHALGFSAGLFAFFHDSHGQPLTERPSASGKPRYNSILKMYAWSDKVVQEVSRQWKSRTGVTNRTVMVIVTPRVVEEVRQHFNCPTLEGAELEDQGVVGTSLTHWEKRIFENEMMTGTYTQNPVVSRITLALMEDTGWYKADYTNADELHWGHNLGCDFATQSCLQWMDDQTSSGGSIHPYCNQAKGASLQTECTRDRTAVAVCNLVEFTEKLSPAFQHFHSLPNVAEDKIEYYGGSVHLADYCPYIQEFNWKKGEKVIRGSMCQVQQNNAKQDQNYLLERYGNGSQCFDHSHQWTLKNCQTKHDVSHWGSGCYQYECSNHTGLVIHIGEEKHRCYKQDQIIHVKVRGGDWLHEGGIVCPLCEEICQCGYFRRQNLMSIDVRIYRRQILTSKVDPRTVRVNKTMDHGISCPVEMNPPERLDDMLQNTNNDPIIIPCSHSSHIACTVLTYISTLAVILQCL